MEEKRKTTKMLKTLEHIGKQYIEQEGDDFSFLFIYPKESLKKDNNGRAKLTVKVLIDLEAKYEEHKVKIDFDEFQEEHIKKYYVLDTQIWEPNDKIWLVASEAKKVDALEKSIFKEDFLKALKKLGITLDNEFVSVLKRLANFDFPNKSLIKEITQYIKKKDFDNQAAIVVIFVKYNDEFIPLSQLKGFKETVEALNKKRFFNIKATKGLSYVSGSFKEDITEPIFIRRVNINKIFVTTTKNFASYFTDKNYIKNYALSNEERIYLNAASYFVLNSLTTQIAGVDHFYVPQVMSTVLTDDFDLIGNLKKLKRSTELIFARQDIEYIEEGISIELDKDLPIWINYYGYETDGKSLKVINIIKDISPSRLIRVYQELTNVKKQLNLFNLKDKNLYSVFWYIPLRGDRNKKEIRDKNNIALKLFGNLLEDTKIDKDLIYSLAIETVNVYRYERFNAYFTVPKNNFDFGIANNIKTYLFFIKLLQNLDLMKTKTNQIYPNTEEKEFFEKMKFTGEQIAMFYLGRVLDQIAYAQVKKQHSSKPVLNKLNYSGMDRDAIIRLATDLFEKTRQYANDLYLPAVERNYALFNLYFNPNNWQMDPKEALFYILTGYSYNLMQKSDTETEESEQQETNN